MTVHGRPNAQSQSIAKNEKVPWLPVGDTGAVKAWMEKNHKTQPYQSVSELFEMKDVLENHKTHNPLYQENFLTQGVGCDDVMALMKILKLTKRERLIECVCPHPEQALKIELSALLFSEYKIPKKAVSKFVEQVVSSKAGKELIEGLRQAMAEEVTLMIKTERHAMRKWAVDRMRRDYPDGKYPSRLTEGDMLDKYFLVKKLLFVKRYIFDWLSRNLDEAFFSKNHFMNIEKKALFALRDNDDKCLLGLKPNGQTQLIRERLEENGQSIDDVIWISLDQFKAIGFMDSGISDELYLNDIAHLIKERVNARINDMSKHKRRPNVFLDANVLDREWYKFFFCDPGAVTMKKRSKGNMEIIICCSQEFRKILEDSHRNEAVIDDIDQNVADSIYAQALILNNFIKRLPQGYDVQFVDGDTESHPLWANFNTSQKYDSSFIKDIQLTVDQ